MNKFNITLTTEEATLIVAALGFIRMNLAFNADKALWQFVPGKTILYDLSQVVALEDTKARLFDAYTSALERHPFNPYIKTF